MFITFEGGEKAGKSTQIDLLETRLIAEGYEVFTCKEPGFTKWGENLREAIKYGDYDFDEVDRLFGMTWSRKLLVPKIREELKNGKIVISDRFIDSTLVYQGIVGGLGLATTNNFVKTWATKDLIPDITFFLDIEVDELLRRMMQQDDKLIDYYDSQKASFHQKIRAGYQELAKNYSRITTINGMGNTDEISEKIYKKIKEKLLN